MICSKCGTKNPKKEFYCSNCAAPLPIKNKKVKFEEFPGNKENNNLYKIKKIIFNLIIVVTLTLLLISSTLLNQEQISNNARGNYRTANTFNGYYANIEAGDREVLFKMVGFSDVKSDILYLNNNSYVTTYAYYKYYDDIDIADSITVYYDENSDVFYLNLNLMYKKEDFNVEDVAIDCNNIIGNFVYLTINKHEVQNAIDAGYYFVKNNSINANISYTVPPMYTDNKGNKYYALNVIVEKK